MPASCASPVERPPRRLPVPILALLAVILAAAIAAIPGTAQAKSYTMPEVDIQATLDDQGALDVVERRTFDFKGDFTCVWWEFDSFGYDSEMTVESVTLEQGGQEVALDPVEFRSSWRNEGGPGTTSYSVDETYDGVYVFFDVHSERIAVTLHYRVEPMATRYEDVVELYWQFVGPEWENASRGVHLELQLPAAGASVAAGDNVRAWAHGPLDGTVEIGDDGVVTVDFPRIEPGSFGEVRATFPVEWIAADAPVESWSYERLPYILDEEESWAADANQSRFLARMVYGAFFAACALFVVISAVLFLRFGREYRPKFRDEYWRDAPDPSLHPLLAKYNESWGEVSTSDFSAELMHLTEIGAIYLGRGSFAKPAMELPGAFRSIAATLFGQQEVDARIAQGGYVNVQDYYLAKLPLADTLRDPIDMAALDLLFGRVGGGADSIWLESVKLFGKRDPEYARACFDGWKRTVKLQGDMAQLIEKPGKTLKGGLMVFAWLIGLAGLVLSQLDPIFYVGFALALIATFTVLRFMPRRSHRGAELHAKSKALKKWLEDFTLLEERLPEDVKTWGMFMVYATLFGISDKVVESLRIRLPEVYNASIGAGSTGGGNWRTANWGVWFAEDGFGGTNYGADSAFAAFSGSFSSAFAPASSGGGGGGCAR